MDKRVMVLNNTPSKYKRDMIDADRRLHDRLSGTYDRKYEESTASRIFLEYEVGELADSIPSSNLLLEVGCGTGISYPLLGRKTSQYVGVDYSPAMAEKAASKDYPGFFVCTDATNLPFRDGVFDAVVARGALHHIKDDGRAVGEAYRVTSPGGVFACVEPNNVNPLISCIRYTMKNVFSSYSRDQRAYGPGSLARLIRGAGFKVSRVSFLGYFSNPFEFTDKMPLSRYVPGFLFELVVCVDRMISKVWAVNRMSWGLLCSAEKKKP